MSNQDLKTRLDVCEADIIDGKSRLIYDRAANASLRAADHILHDLIDDLAGDAKQENALLAHRHLHTLAERLVDNEIVIQSRLAAGFKNRLDALIAEARADFVAASEILAALHAAQKGFFTDTSRDPAPPHSPFQTQFHGGSA